jgi:hypothetical protein
MLRDDVGRLAEFHRRLVFPPSAATISARRSRSASASFDFLRVVCIVTVRRDTRTICWIGTKMSVRPGPRTPLEFSKKKYHAALVLPHHVKLADEI